MKVNEEDTTDDSCKHPEEARVFHKSDGWVNFMWCQKCKQHFMSEAVPRSRKTDGSLGKDDE